MEDFVHGGDTGSDQASDDAAAIPPCCCCCFRKIHRSLDSFVPSTSPVLPAISPHDLPYVPSLLSPPPLFCFFYVFLAADTDGAKEGNTAFAVFSKDASMILMCQPWGLLSVIDAGSLKFIDIVKVCLCWQEFS